MAIIWQVLIANDHLAAFFCGMFTLFPVFAKNISRDSQFILTNYQKCLMAGFMPFTALNASASNLAWFDLAGFGVTWDNYGYLYQDWSFK